jgi:hypothetical protein
MALPSVEDKLLLEFCKVGEVSGRYLTQVPVGLSREKQLSVAPNERETHTSSKFIDAVCILSQPQDTTLVRHDNVKFSEKSQYGKIWVRKDFNSEAKLFRDQSVVLIEAKSKLDCCAIGQLLVYRNLFIQDWPSAKIAQLWIVTSEDDDFIRPTCAELGVNVWISNSFADINRQKKITKARRRSKVWQELHDPGPL